MPVHELLKWVEKFQSLNLNAVVDFEKFNRIAIVHHSTAIEGSTLSLEETTLLITEGITAHGKSMSEHEMVKDHYSALLFVLDQANKKTAITAHFLKQISALVNKNTGNVRSTPLGLCDDSKGDFRIGNVSAGSTYFVNYDKVPQMVNELCEKVQDQITSAKTADEVYQLSFDAHFYLVSIHPWFDGNGRTSRLLMNYIQAYHSKPLSIVFVEDKSAYIKALNDARSRNDIEIFRDFMVRQHIKFLNREIEKYEQRNKGMTFVF